MIDPIAQLWQTIAETLLQAPAQTPEQLATVVCDAILANADLATTLKTDSRMVQINQGNATGYQVLVEGGIAYIGTHYQVDGSTLKPLLETVLCRILQKPVGIPQNLPRGGAPKFVGRDRELATLHEQLQQNDRLAIASVQGMGGVGKTELALQYGLKHLQLGTYAGGVCWLRSREDVRIQIVEFARRQLSLQPPEELELLGRVEYCWRHWREGEVLTIFDDVQDYENIQPYLPPIESRFKVLLTTRSRLGASVREVELQVLEKDAALKLLRAIVGTERVEEELETAQQVCEWLGYLPLGLELVSRYLARKPDLSFAVLWERLQEKRLDAMAFKRAEPGMTASLGVAAAFELSWQDLNESAQQMSAVLSLFALTEIPWPLVEQCWPEMDVEELEEIRDQVLLGTHLLKRVDQRMYQLHQLLKEFFAAKRERRADGEELKQKFYRVVITEAEKVKEKPERSLIKESAIVIAHLRSAIEFLDKPEKQLDLVNCQFWIAELYNAQGRYIEAEPLYQQILEIRQNLLGKISLQVAQSLHSLAELYRSQGRYTEAEPLYQQALGQRQHLLGKNHLQVAQSLNDLAILHYLQGRYTEAEPLFQQALEMRQYLLGEENYQIAQSLGSLALLYNSQGRYGEAEPLYQRALILEKYLLGEEHLDVATTVNNLALLYNLQGRYSEAEPLFQQALLIYEKLLGEKHPHLALSLNNLANLYRSQGKYSEAEPLYRQSFSILEDQLGADHPYVARSLYNLALLYDLQGYYRQSESFYLKAIPILNTKLEEGHLWRQDGSRSFISLLQKTLQENRTNELSDAPLTQSILQELQTGICLGNNELH